VPISWPFTLTDGTVADADHVMANFDAVDDAKADAAAPALTGVLTIDADVNLYRAAANQLATDDDFVVRPGGARTFVGAAGPSGQSGIALGTGGATDTNLYRSAASQLATDDDLLVGGQVFIGGVDVNLYRPAANQLATDDDLLVRPGGARVFVGEAGPGSAAGIALGAAADVNLYRLGADQLASDDDLIVRAGGDRVFVGSAGPGGQAGVSFGAASDANLYRNAANQLATDDDFQAKNGWLLAHVGQGQRVISGRVDAAGAVVSGAGFSASRTSTGVYVVDFTPDFAAAPAVLVTPSGTAAPFHATFVATPAAGSVTVEIVAPDGTTPLNAAFNFVAVGA
jgi:hypothetical protein